MCAKRHEPNAKRRHRRAGCELGPTFGGGWLSVWGLPLLVLLWLLLPLQAAGGPASGPWSLRLVLNLL